jgi:cold shock CspA family protein
MRGPKRTGKPDRPNEPVGTPAHGRIVRLLVGQGHGFIGLTHGLEAFFHRADLDEGTAFNTLAVGQTVWFQLIADAISGARAVRVTTQRAKQREK